MKSDNETFFICPMHPEVKQTGPGDCPKCGMALEPATPVIAKVQTKWVCPMHPEIVRGAPGSCPICGMALEPKTAIAEEEENPELINMTRRFWVSLILSIPLVIIVMRGMIPGLQIDQVISPAFQKWF
jgi:Cu+-exporting ATPase